MRTSVYVCVRASVAACLALAVLSSRAAEAQGIWALEQHHYYDSVLSDPRAPQTTVLFPAKADAFPFAVKDGSSLVWDLSVGAAIPILGFGSHRGTEDPTGVPPRGVGIGMWFPLSFHMIEDMGKDPSNPILDTDYRFGGLVKTQFGLPIGGDGKALHSAHLGVKFQFGHESTHLGDEFELGALREHQAEFVRVNVSYEYYDVGASFEPNFGKKDGQHQVKIRAGNIWLWKPEKGWYSRELLQPFGSFIQGSSRNHEPYVQAEWKWQDAIGEDLSLVASFDARNRTIYQYTPAPDDTKTNPTEPTEWSLNTIVGVRQDRKGQGLSGKITPTYYFRFYHGVNPNGQFRSQRGFTEFGFGVHFSL